MSRSVSKIVAASAVLLLVAHAAPAAVITLSAEYAGERGYGQANLTTEDIDFDGVNTDWRVWDGGDGALFDEKAGADSIGDVTINGNTSNQEEWWDFTWDASDAASGVGQTDIRTGVKVTSANGMLDIAGSVADIGGAGTLFVYTGGWEEKLRLEVEIDGASDAIDIDNGSGGNVKGAVRIRVDYVGVTNPAATIDFTLFGTKKKDVKFNGLLLDVTSVVPEPAATGLLAIVSPLLIRRRRG